MLSPLEEVLVSGPSCTSVTQMDEATLVGEKGCMEGREKSLESRTDLVEEAEYPDGGLRGWLIVVGAFCTCFSGFGFVNSWGVFQSYYETTLLSTSSVSNIAWIGSIQYAFCFVPTIIIGRLFDLGHFKLPFLFGSCLIVVATFLTAECTLYWHFLLCQGFAVGLASGILFGPMWAVTSHWFKRRRGMALGIQACGSSIGGTLFPIIFRNLVNKVGFAWTMRVNGFILLFALIIANLTLYRRLPAVNVSGGLFNLRILKHKPFTVYTASAFFAFLGLYTVLTYIVVSATDSGIDENFSFYLLSIANASSTLGRIIGGFSTDKFGAINTMVPFTLFTAIMTFVWPFVSGRGGFIAVAVLYGSTSGVYVSLIGAPMIALGEIGDVGRRTGLYMNILAVGALLGPPISGAINQASGGYSAVGSYAGSMIIVSAVAMCATKYLVLGSFFGKF